MLNNKFRNYHSLGSFGRAKSARPFLKALGTIMKFIVNLIPLLALSLTYCMSSAGAQISEEEYGPVRGTAFDGSEIVEASCQVLATNDGEEPKLRPTSELYVLDRTEENPLVLTSTDDVELNGVVCWRSEAKFAATDYLIPDHLGIPFYVKTGDGNEETDRTIVLEKTGVGYRIRILSGPAFTDEERKRAIDLISYFNTLESHTDA